MIRTIWRFIIGEKSHEIYLRGFDSGFNKAWETMENKFKETAEKSAELSRNRTVEELIKSNNLKKK